MEWFGLEGLQIICFPCWGGSVTNQIGAPTDKTVLGRGIYSITSEKVQALLEVLRNMFTIREDLEKCYSLNKRLGL